MASLLVLFIAASSTPVDIQLASGVVRGAKQKSGVSSFFGVPFAQPPVGPRRWQPPEREHPTGSNHQPLLPPACPSRVC